MLLAGLRRIVPRGSRGLLVERFGLVPLEEHGSRLASPISLDPTSPLLLRCSYSFLRASRVDELPLSAVVYSDPRRLLYQ